MSLLVSALDRLLQQPWAAPYTRDGQPLAWARAYVRRAYVPIGIDLNGRRLRVAILDPKAITPTLVGCVETVLPRETMMGERIDDIDAISDVLAAILDEREIQQARATIIAGSTQAHVQRIKMVRAPREEIEALIPANPRMKSVAGRVDEMVFDGDILDPDGLSAEMSVLAVAAKKDDILARQQVVVDAGLELARVDVGAAALFNAFMTCRADAATMARAAVIDIGQDSTLVCSLEGGSLTGARSVAVGFHHLLTALSVNSMYTTDETEAAILSGTGIPAQMNPSGYDKWLTTLHDAVKGSIGGGRSTPTASDQQLFLSGFGPMLEGLTTQLGAKLGARVEAFDPTSAMALAEGVALVRPGEGALYTLAIGAALGQILA